MKTTAEKARQIARLRYRMAQVADLQRQRKELEALRVAAAQPRDLATQSARLDSALRVARLALAQSLQSLPASERTHFIKVHGAPGPYPSSDRRAEF